MTVPAVDFKQGVGLACQLWDEKWLKRMINANIMHGARNECNMLNILLYITKSHSACCIIRLADHGNRYGENLYKPPMDAEGSTQLF